MNEPNQVAAASPKPAARKRPIWVTIYLVLSAFISLVAALVFFVLGTGGGGPISTADMGGPVVLIGLAVFNLACFVCTIAIFAWKKWGAFGFFAGLVIIAIIMIYMIYPDISAETVGDLDIVLSIALLPMVPFGFVWRRIKSDLS